MSEGRNIDFSNPSDLSYLEAIVDMVPMLTCRADTVPGPLTDWWKNCLRGLLTTNRSLLAEREQQRQAAS